MSLGPGSTIGQFKVQSLLGAGGMGEVFRARDTRLNRDVAIKILPSDFASDQGRLLRFEQEAKTLAALNHPNILTIHDTGLNNGYPYIVSELLEGRTLREELSTGPLPLRKGIEYALQIAHGLAAAHARGVIHRDLKPENIFITKDGRVKILDFGLAKTQPKFQKGADEERSPVDEHAATVLATTTPGLILGTPAYMSPEQVRGEPADHHSDIFSFGCLLTEMLFGHPPFKRETAIESMNAILKEEPATLHNRSSAAQVSPALERIIRRCLEKEADHRFQSVKDLAFALENACPEAQPGVDPTPKLSRRFLWPAAALIAFAAFLFLLLWPERPRLAPSHTTSFSRKFELTLPGAGHTPGSVSLFPAISPDGRKLAYSNSDGLWLRWLDRIAPPVHLVASTNASHPFWSPDSSDLGFWQGRKVQRISLQGGAPILIASAPQEIVGFSGGGAWLANGRVIFANGMSGLFEAPAQGGEAKSILDVRPGEDEEDLHNPSPLPGSKGVLFVIHRTGDRIDTIALWRPDGPPKILLHLPGGDLWKPVYCPTGYVLFYRRDPSSGVWAFPFSLKSLARTGQPFRVSETGMLPTVSNEGTLLFSLDTPGVFDVRQLAWFDLQGRLIEPVGLPQPGLMSPRISPDGRQIVACAGESWRSLSLMLFDARTGGGIPFAGGPGPDHDAVWWEEGRSLLCTSRVDEKSGVSVCPIDRAGGEQSLFPGELETASARGEFLLLRQRSSSSRASLGYVSMKTDPSKIVPINEAFASMRFAALSPDNQWLAYHSTESGSAEVYLVAFPSFDLSTKRLISRTGGGRNARWHPDGKSLFYLTKDGRTLMSVPLEFGRATTEPTKVFDLPDEVHGGFEFAANHYDIAPDAQRFLMLRRVSSDSVPTSATKPNVRMVLNWSEEFRERK